LDSVLAAKTYGFFLLIVILFQVALALGLPWGKLSMGGKYPGRYPPHMRIVCLAMIALLSLWGAIVFVRAGMLFPAWYDVSVSAIWAVVALNGAGVLMNLITPSKWERIVWAPVTLVFLVCSIVVATA
jgi:hypothetical protein